MNKIKILKDSYKAGEEMKKIFSSFFLCSVLLTGCSQEVSFMVPISQKETTVTIKEEIAPDFIPRNYTIVSIGDSLTQGVGDSTKRGGYLPYLQDKLEEEKSVKATEVFNFGISGFRTPQILNKLNTAEVKNAIQKADIVMITAGGNDVMKVVRENFTQLELKDFDRELINYEKTLISIMDSIRTENKEATIGLMGLYNPFYEFLGDVKELDLIIEKWNDVSRSVLSEYDHTLFINIAEEFRESEENLLYTDFFHPNDKGYELMANNAFSALQESALKTISNRKYIASKKEEEDE